MPANSDFDVVFDQLKQILKPYAARLTVSADSADNFSLDGQTTLRKKPIFFGGVRRGKAYVSYHLMPLYACPDLVEALSPELKKRMQGKSCFNFKTSDPRLFKELARVTKTGFARFKKQGYI